MGRMIGVHFALNAVVDEGNQIVAVLAGDPGEVMRQGIRSCARFIRCRCLRHLISSSLRRRTSQRHQSLSSTKGIGARSEGHERWRHGDRRRRVPEGTGSKSYEQWMEGMPSHAAVMERFQREGFRVGPHKAFQIARDASRVRVLWVSEMSPDFVRRLLLMPCHHLDEALSLARGALSPGARIGVMPAANSTIPVR